MRGFDAHPEFELDSKIGRRIITTVGTRERKRRDFGQRHQLFLDAARELIQRDGLLKFQMARLADRCEYAVGTLYQHFPSKEDLILELVCEDFLQHADLFQRVARWQAGSRDRMFALAVADMRFVAAHPDHFGLAQYAFCEVVWRSASAASRQKVLAAQAPLADVSIGMVERAVAAGDLALHDQTAAEVSAGIWAQIIGMHNLAHADGVMEEFAVRAPYRLLCRHIQALLNGLEWKPLADLVDRKAIDGLIERINDEVFYEGSGK